MECSGEAPLKDFLEVDWPFYELLLIGGLASQGHKCKAKQQHLCAKEFNLELVRPQIPVLGRDLIKVVFVQQDQRVSMPKVGATIQCLQAPAGLQINVGLRSQSMREGGILDQF
jgi:hypothetical protein